MIYQDVYDYAISIGYDGELAEKLIERFKDEEEVEIESCVTTGIHDDLQENYDFSQMSDSEYYYILHDYFAHLNPYTFCPSVEHKVLFGCCISYLSMTKVLR